MSRHKPMVVIAKSTYICGLYIRVLYILVYMSYIRRNAVGTESRLVGAFVCVFLQTHTKLSHFTPTIDVRDHHPQANRSPARM